MSDHFSTLSGPAEVWIKVTDGLAAFSWYAEPFGSSTWWPKVARSSHYIRRGTVAGGGNLDGFLGLRQHKGVLQLRVEYNGLHGMNSAYQVVKIAWEGSAPPPEAAVRRAPGGLDQLPPELRPAVIAGEQAALAALSPHAPAALALRGEAPLFQASIASKRMTSSLKPHDIRRPGVLWYGRSARVLVVGRPALLIVD